MKITDHYHIEELVHPAYIETWGADKVAKYLIKYAPWMVNGQEELRVFAGVPVVVNNYSFLPDYKKYGMQGIVERFGEPGLFIDSGLRHLAHPYGIGFSGHYFACCTDSKPDGYDPRQLQKDILEDQTKHRKIVRMENAEITKAWMHSQFGERYPGQRIEVYNP